MKHEELITQPGTIVSHFKRNGYLKHCKENGIPCDQSAYLYKVIGVARDTENDNNIVVYEALYNMVGRNGMNISVGDLFVRPYKDFVSEVDTIKYPIEKYPDYTQQYRFEVFKSENLAEKMRDWFKGEQK